STVRSGGLRTWATVAEQVMTTEQLLAAWPAQVPFTQENDMLTFDDGLMYCAVSDNSDFGPRGEKGFLNRRTGEIVFVCDDPNQPGSWYGENAAMEFLHNRVRVDAAPEEWLEIPKVVRLPAHHEHWCDERSRKDRPRRDRACTCGAAVKNEQDEHQFIHEF